MTPKTVALAGILLSSLLAGAADVVLSGFTKTTEFVVDLGSVVVGLAFVFMWLHYDGFEAGYRRSPF